VSVALDPAHPEIVFAGFGHGLFRTTNGGGSWLQLAAGLPPQAFVKSIVVDPGDRQVDHVSDWRSGVYVSTNGGATFGPVVDGLTHHTVNALSLSSDGSVLYAAVERDGVYRLGQP
jgi:photosystem II stability/assembly factor-like uncharacterized protein